MFIQYTVLGFEPTTFGHESPPITTRPSTICLLQNEIQGNKNIVGVAVMAYPVSMLVKGLLSVKTLIQL